MKFETLNLDPAWSFSDKLRMNSTPRGAAANYQLMSNTDIKNLEIKKIAADESVLALWVPSSLIPTGLEVMSAWGFRYVQTWIWVKTKKDPLTVLKKQIRSLKKKDLKIKDIYQVLDSFNLDETLAFKMGRLFRQCHEVVLLGVRGKKFYSLLKNKSQRSVSFHAATKHSVKPEILQNRLEIMFPDAKNRLELFARRSRPGWLCAGNENLLTHGEDIRESIRKVEQLNDPTLHQQFISLDSQNLPELSEQKKIQDLWKNL